MIKKRFTVCVVLLSIFLLSFLLIEKDNKEGQRIKREEDWGGDCVVYPLEDEAEPTYIINYSNIEKIEAKRIYYKIPSNFEDADLTEELQEYLFNECDERGIECSLALSLIERESGYYSKCSGDDGNSKGYMQVYEKYHKEVMEAEGVTDLYDAKGNIRVGLHILQDIYDKYGSSGDHCVLMVYNMGSYNANKLWEKGIYSTRYSRYIVSRAKEIKKELKQDQTGD